WPWPGNVPRLRGWRHERNEYRSPAAGGRRRRGHRRAGRRTPAPGARCPRDGAGGFRTGRRQAAAGGDRGGARGPRRRVDAGPPPRGGGARPRGGPRPPAAAAGPRDRLAVGPRRPMPKGHVMGVPGTAAALAGVLSDEGLARIGHDADLPRTEVGEDVAVGAYVAARLGREVVDRLVEPLLGGVYAGDAYRISMR